MPNYRNEAHYFNFVECHIKLYETRTAARRTRFCLDIK